MTVLAIDIPVISDLTQLSWDKVKTEGLVDFDEASTLDFFGIRTKFDDFVRLYVAVIPLVRMAV